MKIITSSVELRDRRKAITQILKPLALDYKKLSVYPSSTPEQYIIPVRDSNNKYSDKNYTNFRFKTTVPSVHAMYYEKWIKNYQDKKSKKEFFYLERAYLHFYIIEPSLGEEKEFLLLHCDPNEPDNAAHAKYKQSLHLHIECSEASWPHCDVWPHAHIALNSGYLNHVLADVNSLTQAIKDAVLMLKEEVLDQFPQK
ncbi:hypothetical protein [Dendronalium sp. ChiSLP03b]|uniref:hypothetical protein n=1 Tax=Dendronalium sp. ChiSLP03b TaxID=3075381 RepID=UPI002AD496E4|nr:hypothetical protein [Dendronalium sp. ChiSLP03b]MDZ8207620.1 hypothetical protein [Dendronalium sp. ChiSLP03b]